MTGAPKRDDCTLESCFSTGLDLAEFATTAGIGRSSDAASSSADLALRKAGAAARRDAEGGEEAALECRVANVIRSAGRAAARPEDLMGGITPRAPNPNEDAADGEGGGGTGRGRDDNFVRFSDLSALGDMNGLLSSLVPGHASEERQGSMSQRSRAARAALLRNRNQSRRQRKMSGSNSSASMVLSRGQRGKQHQKMVCVRKATKKLAKSKY